MNNLEVNFIEYSDFMTKIQQEKMIEVMKKQGVFLKFDNKSKHVEILESEDPSHNLTFRWFKMYEGMLMHDFGDYVLKAESIKKDLCPMIVLAHEFFDALPVNIFQYSKNLGWCEKLININHGGSPE